MPRRHRPFLVAGGDQEELRPGVETRRPKRRGGLPPNCTQKSRHLGQRNQLESKKTTTPAPVPGTYLARYGCGSLTTVGWVRVHGCRKARSPPVRLLLARVLAPWE